MKVASAIHKLSAAKEIQNLRSPSAGGSSVASRKS
tara:strand:- start:180 stop:284 length:105 start_codon:yes stop_codon:yes gene_type:complete